MPVSMVAQGPTESGRAMVNMATATVPDRRYTADFANVLDTGIEFNLLFGQRRITAKHALRSLIVIHFSYDAVPRFLESMEKINDWRDTLVKAGVKSIDLDDLGEEPEQTVSLTANNLIVGFAGREACMDFYIASAFALHGMNKNMNLPVDGVVRISLPTVLFMAILEKIAKLGKKLPVEVKHD